MDKQKEVISHLKEQLEESRRALMKDDEIPVAVCKGIIDELETVKTMIEAPGNVKEEPSMCRNIDELIADFNESAGGSTKLLQEMLSIISDGRVPEKDAVDKLDASIDGLQQKYSSIYQIVSEQIPEDEMPEYGSSVHVYVQAMEESKTLQYKKALEKAKKTLESFISVRSLIAVYSAALEPFQKQARDFLQQLTGDESIDEEKLNRETTGPALFLEAMECEDFDSEESMVIVDAIAEQFSARVSSGISGKKYYIEELEAESEIEEKQSSDNSNAASSDQEVSAISEPATIEDHKTSENESAEEKTEDTSGEEPMNVDDESEIVSEETTDEKEEDSVYVKALYKHNALIHSEEEAGNLASEISPAENKKITSSIFSGDMRKGHEAAEKTIIKQIVKTNCLIPRFLTDVKKMPSSLAENSLQLLTNKGYLRKYTLNPIGSVYKYRPEKSIVTEF